MKIEKENERSTSSYKINLRKKQKNREARILRKGKKEIRGIFPSVRWYGKERILMPENNVGNLAQKKKRGGGNYRAEGEKESAKEIHPDGQGTRSGEEGREQREKKKKKLPTRRAMPEEEEGPA